MLLKSHQRILREVLSLPTAPFSEDHVRCYIFDFCKRRDLQHREDKAGNILVHYKKGSSRLKRPVCLCAHMDHPGFRAVRMGENGNLRAEWHGSVLPDYFPKARVRFHSQGKWISGRIADLTLKTRGLEKPQKMVDTVEVALTRAGDTEIAAGAPGMWDFPDPQIKGSRIYARACDDLAGCSAMLACLDTLLRRRVQTEAYFLFTRAEEVGFIGAIAACRGRTIPKKCLVVAIETSSVLPGVTMGAGPILRVGDKSTIFSPGLTAWCGRIADELSERDRKFTYQRKLMDGGSCESSAYCSLGYDATGLCIALGNYHNCNRHKGKLAPEFIHLDDLANLIKWFVALVSAKSQPDTSDSKLHRRIGQLEKRYRKLLKTTA